MESKPKILATGVYKGVPTRAAWSPGALASDNQQFQDDVGEMAISTQVPAAEKLRLRPGLITWPNLNSAEAMYWSLMYLLDCQPEVSGMQQPEANAVDFIV